LLLEHGADKTKATKTKAKKANKQRKKKKAQEEDEKAEAPAVVGEAFAPAGGSRTRGPTPPCRQSSRSTAISMPSLL